MESSVLDDKRRVVLPKEIAEELGLAEGTAVAIERRKDMVIIKKAMGQKDPLREMMSWDPARTKRPQRVTEREIKEIWG
jgi:AbrB family looped-hinge helix DNA binding protein